jgi:hypothetical protein
MLHGFLTYRVTTLQTPHNGSEPFPVGAQHEVEV